MMGEPAKGTVTSLSSLFPTQESQIAVKRVQETIVKRQTELDLLRGFIADNTNLVNLVQKLPEDLHHDIMVPFGKAAFFPGRLIHSNEFLVLLGEGIYAERSSKQTVDILKRRGKALESQVESLKAVMQDLEAEVSFFDATAAESAEGLVEIREEYVEETSANKAFIVGRSPPIDSPSGAENLKTTSKDDELDRIFSRMDELEKEELEAEKLHEYDEAKLLNEYDETEQKEWIGHRISELPPAPEIISSKERQLHNPLKQLKDGDPLKQLKDEQTTKAQFSCFQNQIPQDFSTNLNFGGSQVNPISKDGSSSSTGLAANKLNLEKKTVSFAEVNEDAQIARTSKNEVSGRKSEPTFDSSKAFTGSIIEHTRNLETNPTENKSASASKPVSRFKMQRK